MHFKLPLGRCRGTGGVPQLRCRLNCLGIINYGSPIPTSSFQRSVLVVNSGIAVADSNFSELVPMTVTVTDPDLIFLNSIGNHFVTNGRFSGGIKRDKLKGTNGFLRKSAVSCENLRFQNAVIPRKSDNLQKSAKICEKVRLWLRLSHLVCPFYSP